MSEKPLHKVLGYSDPRFLETVEDISKKSKEIQAYGIKLLELELKQQAPRRTERRRHAPQSD